MLQSCGPPFLYLFFACFSQETRCKVIRVPASLVPTQCTDHLWVLEYVTRTNKRPQVLANQRSSHAGLLSPANRQYLSSDKRLYAHALRWHDARGSVGGRWLRRMDTNQQATSNIVVLLPVATRRSVLILRVHVGKLSSEFILGQDITYTTRPDSPFITIKFISTRISHPELPNGAAAEGAVATR